MFYWIIASNITGQIGTGSGTHMPDNTLAPADFSLIGLYNDTDNKMTADAQAVYNNPQAYLYQNATFVDNPNWPAIQLQQAKNKQKALVQAELDATLAGGFTSKTTGHKYVTTTNGQSNMEGDIKRFELDSTLASVQFFTIDQNWQPHTYDQLKAAFLDGSKWKDAQYNQQTALNSQIDAAGTPDAVAAIVWSEATY